jgi:hypothetical protein
MVGVIAFTEFLLLPEWRKLPCSVVWLCICVCFLLSSCLLHNHCLGCWVSIYVNTSKWRIEFNYYCVRFEVFTAVTIKNAVFWDVESCRSCVNRRFGGIYRLHLQDRKIHEQGTNVSRIWLNSMVLVSNMVSISTNMQRINNTSQTDQWLTNSMVLVHKRTIPTERPQPVGEVSANFSW